MHYDKDPIESVSREHCCFHFLSLDSVMAVGVWELYIRVSTRFKRSDLSFFRLLLVCCTCVREFGDI